MTTFAEISAYCSTCKATAGEGDCSHKGSPVIRFRQERADGNGAYNVLAMGQRKAKAVAENLDALCQFAGVELVSNAGATKALAETRAKLAAAERRLAAAKGQAGGFDPAELAPQVAKILCAIASSPAKVKAAKAAGKGDEVAMASLVKALAGLLKAPEPARPADPFADLAAEVA